MAKGPGGWWARWRLDRRSALVGVAAGALFVLSLAALANLARSAAPPGRLRTGTAPGASPRAPPAASTPNRPVLPGAVGSLILQMEPALGSFQVEPFVQLWRLDLASGRMEPGPEVATQLQGMPLDSATVADGLILQSASQGVTQAGPTFLLWLPTAPSGTGGPGGAGFAAAAPTPVVEAVAFSVAAENKVAWADEVRTEVASGSVLRATVTNVVGVWSADGGLADESSWVADAGNGVRSGMVTGAYLLNGLTSSPMYVTVGPIVQGCFPGDVVRCSGPSVPTIARREGKALTIVLSGWTVLAEAPCACALLLRRASMRGPTYLWAPGAPPEPFQDPTIEMQRVVAWGPNDGPIAFVGSVGGHDGVFLTSFPGSPPREVRLPPGGAIRDTEAIRGSFGGDGRYLFFTSAGLLFAYDSAADRTMEIPLPGPAPWPAVLGVLWLPFP